MTRVAALVFDLDQTLFDRQHAFDNWIACQGLLHRDQIRLRKLDQNGCGDRECFFTAYECITGKVLDHRVFVSGLMRFIQPDHLLNGSLKQVQADYQIAILTNGGVWTQNAKIDSLSLGEVFTPDRIFISSQIGFAKPDRYAFAFVANAMGVLGSECLYFGDSFHTDVIAARAAGWMGCHVRGPHELTQRLRRLHEVVTC